MRLLFLLTISLISCGDSNLGNETKKKPYLKALESQVNDDNRYDFIYVKNYDDFASAASKAIIYLDSFEIDTTRIWGHTITFLKYDKGLPESDENYDYKWLGSERYEKYCLIHIFYDSKVGNIEFYYYDDGQKISLGQRSYKEVKLRGLGQVWNELYKGQ